MKTKKITRTKNIFASHGWTVRQIADGLITGHGWKGYCGDRYAKDGKVKVTLTVERIK